jgi:hypothetical protein
MNSHSFHFSSLVWSKLLKKQRKEQQRISQKGLFDLTGGARMK